MVCRNPECGVYGVRFSPDRGDYWYMPDDRRVDCGTCEEPMMLVRHRTVETIIAS